MPRSPGMHEKHEGKGAPYTIASIGLPVRIDGSIKPSSRAVGCIRKLGWVGQGSIKAGQGGPATHGIPCGRRGIPSGWWVIPGVWGLDRHQRPDKLIPSRGERPLNSTAIIMQHQRLWSVFAAMFVAAAGTPIWAHPGHGTTDPTSPAHAAESVHLLPLVLMAGVIVLGGFSVVRRYQQARERK